MIILLITDIAFEGLWLLLGYSLLTSLAVTFLLSWGVLFLNRSNRPEFCLLSLHPFALVTAAASFLSPPLLFWKIFL